MANYGDKPIINECFRLKESPASESVPADSFRAAGAPSLIRADSTVMGHEVLAAIFKPRTSPGQTMKDAWGCLAKFDIGHFNIRSEASKSPELVKNPSGRYYIRKQIPFLNISNLAAEQRFNWVTDGFGAKEQPDVRTGRKTFFGPSPISRSLEAGLFSKTDVGALSKRFGPCVREKLSYVCPASCVPSGISGAHFVRRVMGAGLNLAGWAANRKILKWTTSILEISWSRFKTAL